MMDDPGDTMPDDPGDTMPDDPGDTMPDDPGDGAQGGFMDSSHDDPDTAAGASRPAGPAPGGISRRTFVHRGTLTAAAVGVVTSVPGWSGLLTSGVAAAPAAEEDAGQVEGDIGGVAPPLLAHVKDLSTGEISVFQGEREVTIRDAALANRLFSAARP